MKYKIIIGITVIVVAAAATFYGVAVQMKNQLQVGLVRAAINGQPDSTARLDTAVGVNPQGDDPCKGTGGTGQIVSVANNSITIKRRDGSNEIITVTNKTTIRNSAGPVSKSDLRPGDRVTVVVMSHHTATVVLVCNTSSSKPVK